MPEASLFDRLGGPEGIDRLVDDIWENHTSNPKIKQDTKLVTQSQLSKKFANLCMQVLGVLLNIQERTC